jgi:hypothetical protein
MRALAISKRSIVAIRRANSLLDEAKVTEAVLGILVPFLKYGGAPRCVLGTIYVYQIPGAIDLFAWQQFTMCIAAKMD